MFTRALLGMGAVCIMLVMGGCPTPPPAGGPTLQMQRVARGFTAPVALVAPPDESGRLFVVEQIGRIRIIERSGAVRDAAFLDIRDRVVELSPVFDERGLLGLAFHPEYADNGRFYVFYGAPPTDAGLAAELHVSEFSVSSDATRANASSERILLRIPQPQPNHNGGQLAFGPDGFLYISVGDGGGAGDSGPGHTAELGNAQDKTKLNGKILRIDVDEQTAGRDYGIPADNPFVDDDDAAPEIFALGFRNPWRFSIDEPQTGRPRLFVGDVGQALFEEVSLVRAGENYGWNIREGRSCFDPSAAGSPPDNCAAEDADGRPLRGPILAYAHQQDGASFGTAVVGGYVYRGADVPGLRGRYIFGDYSDTALGGQGRIFVAQETDGAWSFEEASVEGPAGGPRLGRLLFAFGVDVEGELYLLVSNTPSPIGSGGEVWKITGTTE